MGLGCLDVVFGPNQDLATLATAGHGDRVEEDRGLVEVDGKVFLGGERGHSTSDVSGQGLNLLEADRFNFTVAGASGEGLEVERSVAGDHGEANPHLVAPSHQGFENLLGRQADFPGDRLGGEVVGVNLVFEQGMGDPSQFEEPHSVGF